MLTKSVKTIVDQVDAMKRLVNEFRDYARLPAAELKPVDLNALVADVLQLSLDEGGDWRGRRAGAHGAGRRLPAHPGRRAAAAPGHPQPAAKRAGRHRRLPVREVTVKTQWNPTSRRVRLAVQDSGTGFPEHILKRAFEPYVTTKAKGTGLGLAVVKKIADEHGARIDLSNRVTDGTVRGAQVSLSFAVAA
jgi:nitrogen fixation/metabolism regulation signal transduction histidine kinase